MDEAGQASTMTGNVERDAWAASTGHGALPLGSTGESTLGPQRASMIQSIGRQTSSAMVRASAWRRKEPHPARCSLLTPIVCSITIAAHPVILESSRCGNIGFNTIGSSVLVENKPCGRQLFVGV
jgi:hypothetical protein